MARPTEQTVSYFKHDTHTDGKTLFVIQKEWGDSGYTFWFKLLELLGRTDGHFIDCRESETWEFLIAQTQLEEVSVTEILDKLAKMKAIDSELWQNRIIWSQNFVDRLEKIYAKRTVEIPQKPSFDTQKPHTSKVSDAETPHKDGSRSPKPTTCSTSSICSDSFDKDIDEPKNGSSSSAQGKTSSSRKPPKTWRDYTEEELAKKTRTFRCVILWERCYSEKLGIEFLSRRQATAMFKTRLEAGWELEDWIPRYFATEDVFVQKFSLESFDSWVKRQKTQAAK